MTLVVELAVIGAVAAISIWMYRQAITAATGWGELVRAAFDIHRLEVYDRLACDGPAQPDRG